MPDLGFGGGRRKRKQQAEKPAPPPEPDDNVLVRYIKIRCPYCGSDKAPVYNTNYLPIRYHKCANPACGRTFKSIEE